MQHPILQWLGCCDTAYLQMIELHGLVKTFGELRAVDGINLTIPKGEFFAVLGPNAAGKTTTIKMMTKRISKPITR